MIQDITVITKSSAYNVIIDSVFSVVAKLTKRLESDIEALKYEESLRCYDNSTGEHVCTFIGTNGGYRIDINPKYRE